MDNLSNKTNDELKTMVDETDDKEVLRAIATHLNISFSGNTGVNTLKTNILSDLMEKEDEDDMDPNDPIVQALKRKQETKNVTPTKAPSVLDLSKAALAKLDPTLEKWTEVERRAIVQAKALKLHRVRISNLDPNDSAVPGAIITVYNKYVGKVSKFIPFDGTSENGYHVPQIILDELKSRTFNMRKEQPNRNGQSFGVKNYKTSIMKKFSIEYLPELTDHEIKTLADDQKARGAIDRS